MHLVWQERTIDRCDFEDSSVVSSANVLKEGVSGFLVQCQDGWHVEFQSSANCLDKGLGLNGEFPDLVDDQHLA